MPPTPPALKLPVAPDWERLAADHREKLARYAGRLLGDWDRGRDVAQEAWFRLMRQPAGKVPPGRELEWLYTVCRNRAIDLLRQRAKRVLSVDDLVAGAGAGAAVDSAHPGDGMERLEERSRLLELLGRLPANQQEVVRLKFLEGFSYKEIARITGLSAGNVGFLIHTAIGRLRRQLGAEKSKEVP